METKQNKTKPKKNLKRERIYFGSFPGHLAPLLLVLWQGRNIRGEGRDEGKLLTSGQQGNREREREAKDKVYISRACDE
jgi:hypothetical protein